jgi:hypothetical protein
MLEAHPAMKAVAPMASPSDMFIGDDFHHNGAFRLAYTFGWLSANARVRKGPSDKDTYRFDPGTPDGYKWFLELGPLSNVNRLHFLGQVREWNAYMEHPDYDEFWQRQNVLSYVKDVRIPVLNVAGWFDAEDFYGPMTIYEQIEKTTPHNQSTLVVGPWSHGGWNASLDGNQLGAVKFAAAPARYYREKVQFPFFAYHLKGKGKLELPEALVYESGLNEWRSYEEWPPVKRTVEKRLYLRAAGRLAWDPPQEPGEAYDSYVSDPAKPVPFTTEIRFSQGHNWMVEDQRFAARRITKLWASTSGTDADYVVKLIDEFSGNAPDNQGHYQMLVSGEVFRAKYRKSFSRPEPMRPGGPELITIDLRDKNHRFKKGHRIVVQVQSSWFPIIDRNPQKFVNIYQATETDYQQAEQRVWRSRERPTHLEVSVLR